MNAESMKDELRIRQFDGEFPKVGHREYWLTMYLDLRESGDDHHTASETVRGEMQLQRALNRLSL